MDAERERLVVEHVDYVRALAHQLCRSLPSQPDSEELLAFGLSGLAEAAARYDPDKGAAFKTFAYYRIRGAMYDGLRSSGWLARTAHAKLRALQGADSLIEQAAVIPGTTPSAVDAARQLTGLLADVSAIYVASVDSFEHTAADPECEGGALAIEQTLTTAQTSRMMRRALEQLPDNERTLIEQHYYGEQTLEDVGKSLGISKSWASRTHAKAIRRLRELMGEEATDSTTTR